MVLTRSDIIATIRYLAALHLGFSEVAVLNSNKSVPISTDDIDHLGNRRIRPVGELVQNQLRAGLARMERVVRERMTTQDIEAIIPQTLINVMPIVAALKEFYGTSQLSQFMDQNNPLPALRTRGACQLLAPVDCPANVPVLRFET